MKIENIFLYSWKQALRFYPLAVWLWFITLVSTLPVFRLVHRSWASYFGSTSIPEEWLRGFEWSVLLEWIYDTEGMISSIFAVWIVMLMIYGLVMIWANGGIIGTLTEENKEAKYNPRSLFFRFSHHGGRLFGRYFRLAVLTIPLIILSFIPLAFGWVGVVFTFLFILVWVMASDLTKMHIAQSDTDLVFKSFFHALYFLLRHGHQVLAVYALAWIALILVYGIYYLLDDAIIPDSGWKIFLMILIQQLWIFWRSLVRVQLFSALSQISDPTKKENTNNPMVVPTMV